MPRQSARRTIADTIKGIYLQKIIQSSAGTKRLGCAALALTISLSVCTGINSVSVAFASEPNDSSFFPQSQTACVKTVSDISDESIKDSLAQAKEFAEQQKLELEAQRQAEIRSNSIEDAITLAESLKGTPYVYGGTTTSGFDCSGFTSYVFKNAYGIELPRSAAAQSSLGEYVSLDEAERGDLLFWGKSGVYHTGIYLGDGVYIHAAASGSVKTQTFDAYCPTFAKRVY